MIQERLLLEQFTFSYSWFVTQFHLQQVLQNMASYFTQNSLLFRHAIYKQIITN